MSMSIQIKYRLLGVLKITLFQYFLNSYECNDYVVNDNAAGDVKILRSCPVVTVVTETLSATGALCSRRSKRLLRSSIGSMRAPSPRGSSLSLHRYWLLCFKLTKIVCKMHAKSETDIKAKKYFL